MILIKRSNDVTKREYLEKDNDSEIDFQKELSINKYRLDEECLSHSGRYAYYSEACAIAKSNVSKAKDNLELTMAEANIRIRQKFADDGVKFTEALVTSTITMDSEVKKSKSELREAEETYARLDVAVKAFEARRSELDNLVKLYCAGYFSNVNADGNTKKNINEQTSSDIRKKLNDKE